MSKKDEWSMNYSWTQPYQINQPLTYVSLPNTIAVLEAVDNIVESMTSYPDAERIINKIIGDMK
jgi:hypothetical protein|tara:strand:- start:62 stop:253 length:192 start_codon:yes stop_codon:yes gene_type:complete